MKVIRAFRNLDRHGQQRAPEVIEEELRQLEPHLARFREDLVRLEVVASQTRGKKRIKVSLRLQLPSGVIAAREEGFEIEPVLRKAFADLRHRVDRKVALLKGEPQWKRPARRARIKALLPPARDRAEAERRTLYFGLIENNLDAVYDTVRRELIYLEANGSVREGLLNVGDLVDTTILKGLERFEQRPAKFSTGDWLTRLAFETIDASAREASHALPDSAASLDAAPEAPAQDPTEADQEMFEFYQPDDVPRLEDLVADSSAADPEAEAARREEALALHRAIAALPSLWRRVLLRLELEKDTAENVSHILGIPEEDVRRVAESARAQIREKMHASGYPADIAGTVREPSRIPQPLQHRDRIERGLLGDVKGEAS
ncbi:flagellar biosynthesis protein FliA [Brucella anthropi]|uniref:flagellar biosynthesis protein FliA n=1 Tax=Brucella anthropi TaxID=529 RepID=UPI0021668140|nr:flagellar biosynthesis protein FliA [Brucella anthropi]UVV70664.1 flagellar biosynthesis protein FliA [Brucella anthropi]